MEAFLANSCILVPLILIPLSLYLASFMRFSRSQKYSNLPSGSMGWPFLGETLKLFKLGQETFMMERVAKYSSVFKTSLWGENVACLCGMEGNKFHFSNQNQPLFDRWVPSSLKKVLFFPENEQGEMKISPAIKLRIHQAILMPDSLKQHIPTMDALARIHMKRYWENNETVKVLPLSKKYTFELACNLLLDVADEAGIKRLADPYYLMGDSLFSLPIDLPGMAYRRALESGRMLRTELMRLIKERREEINTNPVEVSKKTDMLSKILMPEKDGKAEVPFEDMDIATNIVALLLASFDTTSSAAGFTLNYLAELPHIYEKVYQEQMEIKKSKGPDVLLTWEDVDKMKYSWNVVRESLRLVPPAQGGFREATTDITYAGFTIPKGYKTFWSALATHKNPDYFPEPYKFDPTRFEGKGPAPYTFVPFGGGSSICPGKDYAKFEVLVLIHNVVTRFKLRKAIPDEKIVYYASPMPVHGLALNLIPHKMN